MVLPDEPAEQRHAEESNDPGSVAPQRLAREVGNDLHDDAEGRQDEDVDLGVAKEPEEVLPEVIAASVGCHEERGVDRAIHGQHDQRRCQDRSGE